MNRRVFLCSLLIATGSARSDWIVENGPVTDATGRWVGTWSGSGAADGRRGYRFRGRLTFERLLGGESAISLRAD